MIKLEQIWRNIQIEVEARVSTIGYDLYINSLEPFGVLGANKDRLVLLAMTKNMRNIVKNKYYDDIKKATAKVFPSIVDIEIITEEEIDKLGDVAVEVDIPVSERFVANTDEGAHFSDNYTFDTFIVGKSNEFAAAVSKAVAENPGNKYNPLFIWGGVGLGKTHLLHAIGNHITRSNKQLKTIYTSSEKFTNELIEALRDNNNVDAKKSFRTKYRSVDVLMIDDIQFLAGKEGTQEEFFHTFNELYLSNKQIIICSDRPPKEINIEERLKTRFATGVIADIAPPNIETRIAILQKKARAKNNNVSMQVLSLIAERVTSNIREMEGVLNRIVTYANLVGGDCNDMNIVQAALSDYADARQEILTIDSIVDRTCEYFSIDKAVLLGKKKTKDIVVPRHICIYLITDLLSIPLISIGEYFGGKDHSTICHARDKISEEIKTNAKTASQVKDIRDLLYNR